LSFGGARQYKFKALSSRTIILTQAMFSIFWRSLVHQGTYIMNKFSIRAVLLATIMTVPTTNLLAAFDPTVEPAPATADATPAEPSVNAQSSVTTGAVDVVIPRDTPVHLMVVKEVSTKTHQAGHLFPLRVDKAVVINGKTIIPIGAKAWGEVLSAESSGMAGKSGKLSARLLYVEVGNARVVIDGERAATGKSGTAETIMGVIGLGVFGLFARGNNAKLKAGEMFTAFTKEDTAVRL
jgi:hypothetical protein